MTSLGVVRLTRSRRSTREENSYTRSRVAQSVIKVAKAIGTRAKTARQIAEATGLSKPCVYKTIGRMKRRGFKFAETSVRDGESGPKAIAYRVTKPGAISL